jgi:hypothetical protein
MGRYVGQDYTPYTPGEDPTPLELDFVNDMPLGVTLVSAAWQFIPIIGTDPDSAARAAGAATVSGTKTQQLFQDGVPGVVYATEATAIGTDGIPRILWSHIRVLEPS